MGKKSKTPEMPNFQAAAQQQTNAGQQSWVDALRASRATQKTNVGSSTWTQDDKGNWTQNVALNPEQQAIFDKQQEFQKNLIGDATGFLGGMDMSQIDLSQAPGMPTVGQYNQQATDLYRQLMAPQLEQRRSAADARLAAMGLGTGSGKAWENAQRAISDAENRANLEAAQAGISQGNTMFEQGMGLHKQGVSDILDQRQANMRQLSGLMGMSQSVGTPQFQNITVNPYQVGNYQNAANQEYQGNITKANVQNANNPWNQMGGLVGGLAGSFFGPFGSKVGSALGSGLMGGTKNPYDEYGYATPKY